MFMSEMRVDQAAGLRRMAQPNPVRVIAVTSGKGGVGKTNVSVNLAVALADTGKQVMVLDADLSLANIDVLLGLHPDKNLSHVIDGERSLEEVIITGPSGIMVVPASSGVKRLAELSVMENAGLIRAFSELTHDVDTLIIDTAAGINESVTSFSRAAQEVVVVVCDEPASITDAYALIKVLNVEYGIQRFRVLANQAHSAQEGRELFNKISRVTDRYLDVTLEFMGVVPHDDYLKKAVRKQRAVVQAYPRSRSSMAFKNLAQKTDKWPVPSAAGGHLEFFVERLIQSHNGHMEMPV
ncbi:flagellar biosynthesis protein FlhG [Thiogranum longum]|uniref:Flagellar biosynthesis protein FlhG n=1 Tax=Thiogranum longum TaxID=1537524 RepID=A0A4R1HBP3_9GAMM|nr:MinD/ParA family protein [Thiogranum longum]TCK18828.1 flagellar biosynthesis protein FlhG [Thiogranum longum]